MIPGGKNMNSTKSHKASIHFYNKYIRYLAEEIEIKKNLISELSLDEDKETWYSNQSKEKDFIVLNEKDPFEGLKSIWEEQDEDHLLKLIPHLIILMKTLEMTNIDSIEISSTVYVMH